jgi:cytochrome b561
VGWNGICEGHILASGGVRLPLRKLQSEQAVTTLIHVVCPPREPGFGWTGGVHTLLAYYGMLMLITLHVAAGNYHYFVRRDRVLQRMLPGR